MNSEKFCYQSEYNKTPTACCVLHGSFNRHLTQIRLIAERFRMAGIQVLAPKLSASITNTDGFVKFSEEVDCTANQIEMNFLQMMLSLKEMGSRGFCYFVCPDGYLGNSARIEYGFALAAGLPIFFSENPNDMVAFPLESSQIKSVNEMIHLIASESLFATVKNPQVLTPTHHIAVGGIVTDNRGKILVVDDGRNVGMTIPGTRLRQGEDTGAGLSRLESKYRLNNLDLKAQLQIAKPAPGSTYKGPKNVIFDDFLLSANNGKCPYVSLWASPNEVSLMIDGGLIEPNAAQAILRYLGQI